MNAKMFHAPQWDGRETGACTRRNSLLISLGEHQSTRWPSFCHAACSSLFMFVVCRSRLQRHQKPRKYKKTLDFCRMTKTSHFGGSVVSVVFVRNVFKIDATLYRVVGRRKPSGTVLFYLSQLGISSTQTDEMAHLHHHKDVIVLHLVSCKSCVSELESISDVMIQSV